MAHHPGPGTRVQGKDFSFLAVYYLETYLYSLVLITTRDVLAKDVELDAVV